MASYDDWKTTPPEHYIKCGDCEHFHAVPDGSTDYGWCSWNGEWTVYGAVECEGELREDAGYDVDGWYDSRMEAEMEAAS